MWIKRNKILYSILVGCLVDPALQYVVEYQPSYNGVGLWSRLVSVHEDDGITRQLNLASQLLRSVMKESDDATLFISRIVKLNSQLKCMKVNIPPVLLLGILMEGLPKSFEPLITHWLTIPDLTFTIAKEQLRNFYMRKKHKVQAEGLKKGIDHNFAITPPTQGATDPPKTPTQKPQCRTCKKRHHGKCDPKKVRQGQQQPGLQATPGTQFKPSFLKSALKQQSQQQQQQQQQQQPPAQTHVMTVVQGPADTTVPKADWCFAIQGQMKPRTHST